MEAPRLVVLGSGGSSASTFGARAEFARSWLLRVCHEGVPPTPHAAQPRVFTSRQSRRSQSLSPELYVAEERYWTNSTLSNFHLPPRYRLPDKHRCWVKLNVYVGTLKTFQHRRADRPPPAYSKPQTNFSGAVGFYETVCKEFIPRNETAVNWIWRIITLSE